MEKCKLFLKYKLLYWVSLCVLGFTTYVFGHLLVILYYPFKTLDVKQPIKVIETVINRGNDITYIAEYNKSIDKEAVLSIQLYNVDTGYYVSLYSEHSNVLPCIGTAIKTVRIPQNICPGNYKFILTVKYEINMLRTISKRFISEVFKII